MRRPSMHYIQDLTTAEVRLLTQVLCLPINETPTSVWLQDQHSKIRRLPKNLLKPDSLLPRIAKSFTFAKEKACLCEAHKCLNPYLIRRIFLQVSGECTRGVARLEENPYLPTNLSEFLKSIHSVNGLWMAPDMYRALFKASFDDARYERVESGCEACILATVGGNPKILFDLRTSMLGRRKKRAPVARLLRLVEAWIDRTEFAVLIRENSDILSREVRECRRQLQHARRQTRRNKKDGILDPVAEKCDALSPTGSTDALLASTSNERGDEDDDQGHDFEDSIINEYLTRYSTSALALERPQSRDMHPAFRNSILFDAPSGTFVPKSTTRENPRHPHRSHSQLTQCTQWPVLNQSLAPPLNTSAGQAQHPLKHSIAAQELGGASACSASSHSRTNIATSRISSEDWANDYRDLLASSPDSDQLNFERARNVRENANGNWI